MKFDVSNYPSSSVVIHVSTEKEAKIFCIYLDKIGRKWNSGDSYKDHTNFSFYKENTCYNFNEGAFCDKEYYQHFNYEILEFKDFDWPEIKEEGKGGFLNEIEEFLAIANEGLGITQKALEKIKEAYILKEELKWDTNSVPKQKQ